MTKKEAVRRFKDYVLPHVYNLYGKKDKPAVRQSWCEFVDSLERDRYITPKQAFTWDNPFS
jgi:hypothetical protein